MVSMFHFTGNIPRPFTEAAFNKMEMAKYSKAFEERYLSQELRLQLGNIAIVMNAMHDRKIVFKTDF